METPAKTLETARGWTDWRPFPNWLQWGWVQKVINLTWYEWLGWITEIGLLVTFIVVTQTQFAQEEPRAGWVMILVTLVFCGPGAWLMGWYRPKPGSPFSAYDVGAIICFAIWAVTMFYLVVPSPEFVPGPFGSPTV